MISIASNSMKQTLYQYLLQYWSIFKKRSYILFTWLISAIICVEEVRSVKFRYDNFISKYCNKTLNSFYYFLSYANFSCDALLTTTVKIVLSLAAQEIRIFKEHNVEGISTEPETQKYLTYFVYSLRWGIEVLFYEHKFFWSFGNYMARTQAAIDRYVNFIGIAFAFVQVLPFICIRFEDNKFWSPQAIKHEVSGQLSSKASKTTKFILRSQVLLRASSD